ncbi:type I 3-dehydroquinate dehydratase [Faecalitalea cylindroides]
MSDMGMISRIIGEMFDSEYTFCSLTTSSAPGQLPLEKMVEYLNILD